MDADETEFMENLFDALCSALGEAPIKKLFLESEGPDLMVLMMKCVRQSSFLNYSFNSTPIGRGYNLVRDLSRRLIMPCPDHMVLQFVPPSLKP